MDQFLYVFDRRTFVHRDYFWIPEFKGHFKKRRHLDLTSRNWTKTVRNIRSSWFLINFKDSRKYELVTTIAIKSGNVLSLPLGIILDRVGTFHCRICCQILITIGLILLIFTIYNPYLLFGSIPLLAAGGFSLLRKVQFLFKKVVIFNYSKNIHF